MRIRRSYLPLLIIIFVLLLLAITNPGQERFKTFVKEQLTKRKFTEKDIENNLICEKTANYILFSQYKFQVKDYGILMEEGYIGILGTFFPTGTTTNDGQ